MVAIVMLPVQRQITQPLLCLGMAPIGFAVAPHEGGVVVTIADTIVGERTKGSQCESVSKIDRCL